MIYTVVIYCEDDNDGVCNFTTKEKAVKAFFNYFEDGGIKEELDLIAEDLKDRSKAIEKYDLDTVVGWEDYYMEVTPGYWKACEILQNFLDNNEMTSVQVGDYGYIEANEVM